MLSRVRRKGTLSHCWWEYRLVQTLGKTIWRFLKKIKNRTTIWSSNSTPEYMHKENENTDLKIYIHPNVHQYSSATQSCLTLCDPMDCSTPGFSVHHQLPEMFKLMSIKSVMPSNHLILCHPFLLPRSIFPSIRVCSNESVLRTRWPKYWSFSFSISPSNEYSGLISFKID